MGMAYLLVSVCVLVLTALYIIIVYEVLFGEAED